MFHEMSDDNRKALIAELTACQDHILRREGVERPTKELFPGATGDMLPAGTGHAYGRLENALNYLRASEAGSSDLIKDTHGSGSFFRHTSGCYSVTFITRKRWSVSRFGSKGHWRVSLDAGQYWVSAPGESPFLAPSDHWKGVFDTIEDYGL